MGESFRTARRPLPAGITAHAHLCAALLLGLVVFGYLWPVLVGGEILSPIADLYIVRPWQPYAPAGVEQWQNGMLIDLPVVLYPWRLLVRELIHTGVLPAWNPYALAGSPLYSNPQTGLFSLFNVPLWILPLAYALGVSAALKLFVGAFGTYLLARRLRLGFLPGLLAGVAFAFSAVNIVWLTHAELPGVLMLLPWAILLVERIFAEGRLGGALALVLVVAVALGGGHPGMQVHFLAITALYALARAVCAEGERGRRARALALVGVALGVGALLMAFMLIPEARSAHETVGVAARRAGNLAGQRIPFDALQTIAFPDRWGRPSGFENVVDRAHNPFGFVNYNERTFYPGIVALLFACIGLIARGGWRRKAPFALLAFVGLAVPLRVPGVYWLATHLPVLDSVEAQRLHFAFEFGVAVLAAFGLEAVLVRGRARGQLVMPALALLLGLLVIATVDTAGADVEHTLRHFLTGVDYASSGVLALTSAVWFLLFALGVALAVLLARGPTRWRVAAGAAVVLLAVADALHFANGYQPMGPASKVIPPVTPGIAYLERHRDEGRVVGVDAVLPPDTALLYGLRDVRGYDPPQPTTRLLALWLLVNPAQRGEAPLEVPLSSFSAQAVKVLSVLGARYMMFAPGFRLASSARRTLRVVYDGQDATIVANADAAPRALVPSRVVMTSGPAGDRRAIAERDFDARTTATVERARSGRSPPAARGTVTLVRERNASVTLRAYLDRGGLVVLNDALMDGWSVRVDGRTAPALRVNGVMRGVAVPAGSHEIVWSYAVPGLRLGGLLSLLTLAALIAGVITGRLRARARERAQLRRTG
jgi:hypothetical protein